MSFDDEREYPAPGWDFSDDEVEDPDKDDIDVSDILLATAAEILSKLTHKVMPTRAHLVVNFMSEGGKTYTETFTTLGSNKAQVFGDLSLEARRIEADYVDDV